MADGEKEGRTEIQKYEYLENKTSFLKWNKKQFSVFEGLSFGDNNKNSGPKLKFTISLEEVKTFLINYKSAWINFWWI